MLTIAPHALLELAVLKTEFAQPLGELTTDPAILRLFDGQSEAPLQSNDDVRLKVRDLLRAVGFKPTGRSKPASEYLIKAAAKGTLRSINPAVDVCNAVSLHSGLPISVVDLDCTTAPLSVSVADKDARYVFNLSGQEIDLGGLLCLKDAEGPCANAVKDSQRTKTNEATRRTISLIWGTTDLPGRAAEAAAWYVELTNLMDAQIEEVRV